MRKLQSPPRVDRKAIVAALGRENGAGVAEFLRQANAEYWGWDEVRRHPQPAGLTPPVTWTLLKLTRSHRRPLPLLDPAGRPFTFWLPDHAQQVLHDVDRQGGVRATGVGSADLFEQMKERVLIDSLMEEAIATSQIEGAVTTRRVAKDMLLSGRAPRDRSEQMIANGYRTIRMLLARKDEPLSLTLLHEIQQSMTEGTLDDLRDGGRLRTIADRVEVIDSRDNETVFVPPPADRLAERIQKMVMFANQPRDSAPFIHPLVRAAILHFWLAYEHPYVDGNGRTARALFYWSMLRHGYWLFEFLTISRIIHSAPMRYYRSYLHTEQDDNDLTYFLMFQFDVTRRALAELHERLAAMRREQTRVRGLAIASGLNARQRAIIDHAARHPNQIYTFQSHQASHGIAYQTAQRDLLGLLQRGLLIETGGQRPREFMPARDLPKRVRQKR